MARVTHCPVNVAGIPWENVQALRRKGVDARLVVFNRGQAAPGGRLVARPARRAAAPARDAVRARSARLLPRTDVFHFYFGLTLVPKSLQFPLLRATRQARASSTTSAPTSAARRPPSSPTASAPDARDRRLLRRDPLGARGARRAARARPAPVHAAAAVATARGRSSSTRRRTARRRARSYVIEACEQLPVELDIVEGVPHEEARERYARADIVVDQLNAGWHGVFALEAMALGKPVVAHLKPDVVERSAEGFGIRVPIVPATKETLVDALRPLVEDPALRREIGAASRAYVEQVHDIDRVADRLLDDLRCAVVARPRAQATRHAVGDLRPRRASSRG